MVIPAMLLSSNAGQRSHLETQIRLVHDVTGKPLNEIRMDLEYTGDAQKTIERICDGEFLKGTMRDPTSKVQPSNFVAPKFPSLSAARDEAERLQRRKGKGTAKTAPQALEVIDLCDSDDHSSPAVRFKRPSTFQSSDVWGSAATAGSSIAGPSNVSSSTATDSFASIIRPYPSATAAPKAATTKPPPPVFSSSPLFRDAPSSSSPSPSPPLPPAHSPQHSPNKQPKTIAPINFSSPAAPAATTPQSNKRQKIIHVINLESDSDDLTPVPCQLQSIASPAVKKTSASLSATTRALLRELEEFSEDSDSDEVGGLNSKKRVNNTTPRKATTTKTAKAVPAKRKTKIVAAEEADADEDGGSEQDPPVGRPPKKGGRLSEAEKARRAVEKEEAKLQRKRDREAKAAEKEKVKLQKKREKEAKDLEKKMEQELLSVNKLSTSKKDSTLEMVVDISQHLKDTPIGEQLQRFLAGIGCEVNTTWYPTVGEGTWRVVKWRRKVKAEYDEGRGMFLPLPEMKVTDEYHVLIYLTAQEFLDIAMDGDDSRLALHVSRLQQFSPREAREVKLIYLIEGLETLIRKNKSNRNRVYQNKVRAVLGVNEGRAADADLIDEDEIQDALLRLQVIHGCLIHHTATGMETAEWISKFTGDISTIPYKKSRQIADMAFCTDVGQVRTGVGKTDTYIRMLEEINRVTPSVANGIASEYPDVTALVKGFEKHGEHALADLPNITIGGQLMSRDIGAACSKRIYAIFMDTDPESVEA